jgi:hypothetical protein
MNIKKYLSFDFVDFVFLIKKKEFIFQYITIQNVHLRVMFNNT